MSRNPLQRCVLPKYNVALPVCSLLLFFLAASNNLLLAKSEWLSPRMDNLAVTADTMKKPMMTAKKMNPVTSPARTSKTNKVAVAATPPSIATAESDSTPKKTAAISPQQAVEVMPHYQPNNDSLFAFLARNIKYPDIARQVKAEGVVYVGFMVEKEGSISEISIKKGIIYTNAMQAAQGSLEKEAIRVVSLMPKWKAGTLKGEPVRASFVLPIRFKLD